MKLQVELADSRTKYLPETQSISFEKSWYYYLTSFIHSYEGNKKKLQKKFNSGR
jgi:hypothetical protein